MEARDVFMVLKTKGLEYDDRVRKEALSLTRLGSAVTVLVLEESNEREVRQLWGRVSAVSFPLVTRRLFSQGRGLILKLLEFNGRAAWGLLWNPPDVVWVHNREAAPVLAAALALRSAGLVRRVVWDQHELPGDRVLEHGLLRRVWSLLMRRCDVVIVANPERRECLREILPGGDRVRFAILRNWADRELRAVPKRKLPPVLQDWLEGRHYFLAQGGAHPGRHFEELASAVVERASDDIGLVVVGARPELLIASLRKRWGSAFDRRVFFTGWVPQMEVPRFIDHCMASIVLYDAESPNAWLCAPNRLYQAVARGRPVLVGANPPMATLVGRHGLGVVLEGSGDSVEDIAQGIRSVLSKPDRFRDGLQRVADEFVWERQDARVREIIGDEREGKESVECPR